MLRRFYIVLSVVAFCCALLPAPALAGAAHRLVAGTELIADIVRDLLPGNVELLTLIPASSCPGHHDIRASDMAFFSKAEMVVIHRWQEDYPGIPEAMEAAQLSQDALKIIDNRGSFLVPANQIAASIQIAGLLALLEAVDKDALDARLQSRIARINALADECKALLEPYSGTPALSAFMQEEFVRWTGMKVIAHYGRGEDMSPGTLMNLADKGKAAGVVVVVDNIQSGADAGVPLARELKAAHVGFSNFPMFSPEAPTYETLLKLNTILLRDALAVRLNNAN